MVQLNRDGHLRESGVEAAAAEVREWARPLSGPHDVADLVDRARGNRYVLVGDASHGTSEFYAWRAVLTARLLDEGDFDFVAVEGDWTSCWVPNQFVTHLAGGPETVREAVAAFDRWPTWMWANWETVEFLEWLRLHNEERAPAERVGFYGMDVYGLYDAMDAALEYLDEHHPEAAAEAREAYRCFEPYGEDPQEYGRAATRLVPEDCADEVVEVLADLREHLPAADGVVPNGMPEAAFAGEQAALVARNAETYYRAMFGGGEDSWNVRDRHMVETLERLREHHDGDARGIVWAHNTHVGDARATDMPERGRLNVGQLLREDHGDDVFVVGFATHAGDVVAADAWGSETATMQVPSAKPGSYEHVFHEAGPAGVTEGAGPAGVTEGAGPAGLTGDDVSAESPSTGSTSDDDGTVGTRDRLLFTDDLPPNAAMAEPRGHRAIGVVYRPALESGNYVPTALADRYDAFVHLDETRALHPVEVHPAREAVPDLYPTGL